MLGPQPQKGILVQKLVDPSNWGTHRAISSFVPFFQWVSSTAGQRRRFYLATKCSVFAVRFDMGVWNGFDPDGPTLLLRWPCTPVCLMKISKLHSSILMGVSGAARTFFCFGYHLLEHQLLESFLWQNQSASSEVLFISGREKTALQKYVIVFLGQSISRIRIEWEGSERICLNNKTRVPQTRLD